MWSIVRRLLPFIWLLLAAEWTTSAQTAPAKHAIAFRNVTVIDVMAGQAQPGMTVVIRGNRIVDVGPASTKVPADADVIPADGKFLVPGLWDMHIHAIGNPGIREFTNPLLIAHGVTGVRSMGRVALADILQEREAVLDGKAIGPRIIVSGAILDGAYPVWPEAVAVTSPESARSLVD